MGRSPRFRSVAVAVALVLGLLAALWTGQAARPARGGGFAAVGEAAKDRESPEAVRTVHVFTPMTPRAAKTWLRLQEPITVSFPDESPFEDFLKSFKEATRDREKKEPGIAIYVDPVGMNEAEKTMTSPIVLDLVDIPAATALELVLRQLGLKYSVQKDGLVVITSVDHEGDVEPINDPAPAMLEELSALRAEVAALRREVARLGRGR
jgi:hypothetical protein